jgi:hypothetical protein
MIRLEAYVAPRLGQFYWAFFNRVCITRIAHSLAMELSMMAERHIKLLEIDV